MYELITEIPARSLKITAGVFCTAPLVVHLYRSVSSDSCQIILRTRLHPCTAANIILIGKLRLITASEATVMLLKFVKLILSTRQMEKDEKVFPLLGNKSLTALT